MNGNICPSLIDAFPGAMRVFPSKRDADTLEDGDTTIQERRKASMTDILSIVRR
jgi:hypothetical protein